MIGRKLLTKSTNIQPQVVVETEVSTSSVKSSDNSQIEFFKKIWGSTVKTGKAAKRNLNVVAHFGKVAFLMDRFKKCLDIMDAQQESNNALLRQIGVQAELIQVLQRELDEARSQLEPVVENPQQ